MRYAKVFKKSPIGFHTYIHAADAFLDGFAANHTDGKDWRLEEDNYTLMLCSTVGSNHYIDTIFDCSIVRRYSFSFRVA